MHFRKRARKQSHARGCGIGVQSTFVCFRSEKWIQHKMPVQLPTLHTDLDQEEVKALTTDHKLVQWMITCHTVNNRCWQ